MLLYGFGTRSITGLCHHEYKFVKMVLWSEIIAEFSFVCVVTKYFPPGFSVLSAWGAFIRLALIWLLFTYKVSNQMSLFQRDLSNTLFKSATPLIHSLSINCFIFFMALKLNHYFFLYFLPSWSTSWPLYPLRAYFWSGSVSIRAITVAPTVKE